MIDFNGFALDIRAHFMALTYAFRYGRDLTPQILRDRYTQNNKYV